MFIPRRGDSGQEGAALFHHPALTAFCRPGPAWPRAGQKDETTEVKLQGAGRGIAGGRAGERPA